MYNLLKPKTHTNQWGEATGLVASKAEFQVLPYTLFSETVTASIDYYDDEENQVGSFEYVTIKTPEKWASDDNYLINAFKKEIGAE